MDILLADPESALAHHCLSAYTAELRTRFPEGFLEALRLGTHAVLTDAAARYRSAGYAETDPYGDTR